MRLAFCAYFLSDTSACDSALKGQAINTRLHLQQSFPCPQWNPIATDVINMLVYDAHLNINHQYLIIPLTFLITTCQERGHWLTLLSPCLESLPNNPSHARPWAATFLVKQINLKCCVVPNLPRTTHNEKQRAEKLNISVMLKSSFCTSQHCLFYVCGFKSCREKSTVHYNDDQHLWSKLHLLCFVNNKLF